MRGIHHVMKGSKARKVAVPDQQRLRGLPAVSAILALREAAALLGRFGHQALTEAIRSVVAEARSQLKRKSGDVPDAATLLERAGAVLEQQEQSSLQPVFNLTGTVLHTNLGRALLAEAAVASAITAMRENVTLEYELLPGGRGERDHHVRALLCKLTGAEDATVVNNNAAAVVLCINTLALAREAIVSRGELIEIGGAFRMPDIMARAGAVMVEVGTTNRTHLRDYEDHLRDETGLILKVHTSNYRIRGFTSEVAATRLAALATEAQVPLLHDLGSGSLVDLSHFGLRKEPTVGEAVAQGADLVTFSADKLLGGPQAGIIVGRANLIEKIRRNPLRRALRLDKIRLAALEATLRLYQDPGRLSERLPTLKLLVRPRSEIEALARELAAPVQKTLGEAFTVEICACVSEVGSGALPLEALDSCGLAIRPRTARRGAVLEDLARALRGLPRPIVGRIENGGLILDLRCLTDPGAFLVALSALEIAHTPNSAGE
jgi:L-seryl-tRNA(Ser) seleniumtransferase